MIAKNEEQNLRRSLPTVVGLADEIVLVDSGSTDETVAVAGQFNARVICQPWLGFGQQKNFAIGLCSGDWILSLDADEQLSAELVHSITEILAASPGQIAGYTMARRNYFLHRPMRYGGLYPDRKLRLFRRGRARFEDRAVHESMITEGLTGELTGDLLHHAYPTLALYIEHMNRYSTASTPATLNKGRTGRSRPAFLWNTLANPVATFAYNYVLRGGFRDGREGLLLHLYHSAYVSWKYAKAWEQARKEA